MNRAKGKESYYNPIPEIDEQIVGEQFGNWKVLKYVETQPGGRRMYECLCSCCNKKTKMFHKGYLIKAPMNSSCGCQPSPIKNRRRPQSSFNTFVEEKDYLRVYDTTNKSFIIDKESKDLLLGKYWCVNYRNEVNSKSIVEGTIKLHRVLMGVNDPKQIIDHINGDTLDNRLSNLRIVTPLENAWNINPVSNNSSGRRGVYWIKSRKRWQAEIKCNGIKHHLGFYKNLEDAIKAREKGEEKYYGEYKRKGEGENE